MATFNELMDLLDYRSLGALYEEYGARSSVNSFFDFYVGEPAREATREVEEILDEGGDVNDVPLESEAGGGSVERFPTDRVEYIYLGAMREPAPINRRGSPAYVLQPTGADSRRISLVRTFNHLRLGVDALMMLREPDQWLLQQNGRREVARQLRDFAARHRVLKEVFLSKLMTTGRVYVGPEGEILESATGAVYDIDFGVPASHTGQLVYDGGTLIDIPWTDTQNADILSDMDLIDIVAEEDSVERPRHYWLNSKHKQVFRNNKLLKEWYGGVEKLNRALDGDAFEINNKVVHFFGGVYVDSSGSTKPYIPEGIAVVTPDLGPWFLNGVGREMVPTTLDVSATAEDAMSNLTEVYGDFAYAKLNHDPVSLSVYGGSNWIYALRNPKSIWIATIDF